MPRLFIALWPPQHIAEDLYALPRKDQRGVRFVMPESWHVTLRFLGETSIDAVLGAMEGLDLPAATARLGPGVDVLSERVLVVPVAGVDDLARVVTQRTAVLGEPPPKRFVGHLTLARLKRFAEMPKALGAMIEGEFDVEEVALVRSRLQRDGVKYETIETWPVGDGSYSAWPK